MNSNLGIPTMLRYVNVGNKNLIVVGDEDTRIKIYNEERMHEIISFWFLVRRVPMQIIQPSKDEIVLMVKKQNQVNIQMHEELEEFIELIGFKTEQLCSPEMDGKVFFTSKEKDEKG